MSWVSMLYVYRLEPGWGNSVDGPTISNESEKDFGLLKGYPSKQALWG